MSFENLTHRFLDAQESTILNFSSQPTLLTSPSLSWARLLSAILIVLSGSYLYRKTQTHYRLRQFEGPWVAKWSRLWLLRTVLSGKMNLTFYEVSKRYGPVARIGPNSLMVSDAALWRKICAVRSPYMRSDWYKGMRLEPDKDVILTYRSAKHQEMRRKMATGVRSMPFSAAPLLTYSVRRKG